MNNGIELESVIDNLPSAIIVVNQDRRVQLANKMSEYFANKSKRDFYGLYGGEAFGCVHSNIVSEGCGFAPVCAFCTVKNTVMDTFHTKNGKTNIETEMEFFNAGKRNLRIATNYLDISPEPVVVLAMEDITDLKRMEQEKIASEKFQGVLEMAGAVCHELNQPMQAIAVYSELLILDLGDRGQKNDELKQIKEQISRMGKITKKLMGITRYETKGYVFEGKKIIDIDKASEANERLSEIRENTAD